MHQCPLGASGLSTAGKWEATSGKFGVPASGLTDIQKANTFQYLVEYNSQVSIKADYSHCSGSYRRVLGASLLEVLSLL